MAGRRLQVTYGNSTQNETEPDQCAQGLTGVYCRLCAPGPTSELVYYVPSTDDEVAHCEPCGDSLWQTALQGAAFLAFCAVVLLLFMLCARKVPKKYGQGLKGRLAYVNAIYSPQNKLKIILGFYQVCHCFPHRTRGSLQHSMALSAILNSFACCR